MKSQYLWLGVGLVLLAVFVRACVLRPGAAYPGAHFNRGHNAAWLDVTWAMDEHSPAEVQALASELARHQIHTVFVYTSYLKPGGQFNPTYTHAAEFVAEIKAVSPELDVQAWIGIPIHEPGVPASGYVHWEDAAVRQAVAGFCGQMIAEAGYDGVHLDPEPVRDGDRNLLALLAEVRQAIGPDKTLSLATRRIMPLLPDLHIPYADRMVWSASYYRQLAQRVDQIALMTYDSGLPWAPLYRLWGRYEVVAITCALAGQDVQVFIGIPTSAEKTRSHIPAAENMASGLLGTIDGLNDAVSRPGVVTGVAIYPHWETGAGEWVTYERLWLGEPQGPYGFSPRS